MVGDEYSNQGSCIVTEERNANAHDHFVKSTRKHVLMITNHGIHQWRVVPGLPDTGGQNVYVNQFTESLIDLGYRVTIANRGGYAHPKTSEMLTGIDYHPTGHARIIYLEDGLHEFVRKEDMNERIELLVEDLKQKLLQDGIGYDLIISHYWDAGKIGNLLNRTSDRRVPHIWVPHSLGALKKRNVNPATWGNLRIDERISHEREILLDVDGCVSTSTAIRDTFLHDYQYEARYFLPPCIDEIRYHPRSTNEIEPGWQFLNKQTGISIQDLKNRIFITEISRTDKTKRKDVVIQAFARVIKEVPQAMLMLSIDEHAGELNAYLRNLIKEHELENDVIVLGSVWEQLPLLYNITSIYCTPSVMEGFGMTAQEAAATGKPVVSSHLVPFVVEYLVGKAPYCDKVPKNGEMVDILYGEGGVVVPADFVDGFASALLKLLQGDILRHLMGKRALDITIPYFTWNRMTSYLLEDLGFETYGTIRGNGRSHSHVELPSDPTSYPPRRAV